MEKVLMYMHAGSGNHGCEAIVNVVTSLLNGRGITPVLASNDEAEDRRYHPGELERAGALRIVGERHIDRDLAAHIAYYGWRRLTGDNESFLRYRFRDALRAIGPSEDAPVAVSIGGDNYCYPSLHSDLRLANSMLRRKGYRTILLGCSIEPEMVPSLKGDLEGFERIIARESITYHALEEAGLGGSGRLVLLPDPAFGLEPEDTALPDGMEEGGCVGINLSPMVRDDYGSADIVMSNIKTLICDILDNTDLGVVLIPHVVRPNGDDRPVLSAIRAMFPGETRIITAADQSAGRLKRVIGACRFFVGARTHSTIAAYSQAVPTLVLGYSVKSRGIAADLFGGDIKDLVVPVQGLSGEKELSRAFSVVMERENELRSTLESQMPDYRERVCQLSRF